MKLSLYIRKHFIKKLYEKYDLEARSFSIFKESSVKRNVTYLEVFWGDRFQQGVGSGAVMPPYGSRANS